MSHFRTPLMSSYLVLESPEGFLQPILQPDPRRIFLKNPRLPQSLPWDSPKLPTERRMKSKFIRICSGSAHSLSWQGLLQTHQKCCSWNFVHFLVDSRCLQTQLPLRGTLLTCLQRLSSNTSVKRSPSYLVWVRYLYSIYYFLYYSPQHTMLSLVFLPNWLQASWATQRQVTFLIHYIFTCRSSVNETPLTITSAKTVQDIISYWEKEAKRKKE